MPHPPQLTGLRYAPGLGTLPPGYQIVQGDIQYTGYSHSHCASPSGGCGFRQRQSNYRYGPIPETRFVPETTAPGLTFRRPECRSDISWVGARVQAESRDENTHGEDILDVFGVVEHLWAPLEWAGTYYPTGPALPTRAKEVEVSLPLFKPVTCGFPLGDVEDPQLSHIIGSRTIYHVSPNGQVVVTCPSPEKLPTCPQANRFQLSVPSHSVPSSSTTFWNRAPCNKQIQFPSNITNSAAV